MKALFFSFTLYLMRELDLHNTRLDGRYDVLKTLGRGSYAEVFVARDNMAAPNSPHRLVVIKALNVFLQDDLDADLERTLIENFQNEAVALDRVRHPNIISRFGHGTARDLRGLVFHYLVLEFMSGGELATLCKGKPIPFSQAMNFLEQTCAGLGFAHKQNIIHRDIKPQNLLLTEDRRILKIADFGVARTTLSDAPVTRVGTNIYAPPEHSPLTILSGAANQTASFRLTPAADIYSLAKTAFVMFSGESPRRFSNAPITELPSSVSQEMWAGGMLRVLQKATQNDPTMRQQTVAEFWNDLANVKYAAENLDDNADTPTQIGKHKFVPSAATSKDFIAEAPAQPKFRPSQEQIELPSDAPNRPKIVVQFAEPPKTQDFVLPSQQSTNFNHQTANFPLPNQPTPHSQAVNVPSHQPPIYAPPTVQQNSPQVAVETPRKSKGKFFRRIIVATIFLAIFTGILLGTYNYLHRGGSLITPTATNQQKATVTASGANLRTSPNKNDDNNIIGTLANGTELSIIRTQDNWYYVEVVKQSKSTERPVDNGKQGWIAKSVISIQ